jgi:late competence protein required for DNA uptake (superfamily II DNA/RNA helicase)
MDTKTSNETRKKETSHALICNTSTMRIERNVTTENTQQVKIALKLPKTVYGVPVTVTSPLLFFFF